MSPIDVKQLRLKLGLSQQELAEKTGINKGRINNWEQGKGKPKVKDNEILLRLLEEAEMVRQTQHIIDYRDSYIKTLQFENSVLRERLEKYEKGKGTS